MKITARIDWLRVTVPADMTAARTLLSDMDCNTTLDDCHAFPWYTHSRRISGGGRVDWNEDAPRQGVLYTFTGSDLEAQTLRGIFPAALVNRFRNVPRANFTRLDLALDVYDAAAQPTALMEDFRTGEVNTHVQKATSVMGYQKDGEIHGETQYFGSRTGERLLRCYNKAAQQKIEGAWTRLELELKQQQAKRAAAALETAGVGQVAAGMMDEFIPFRVPWYRAVMDQCTAGNFGAPAVGRHEGDTQRWVHKVAGPAYLHALQAGDAMAWTMLVETMAHDHQHLYKMLTRRIIEDDSKNLNT